MQEYKYPWAKPLFVGKEKKYVNQALSSTWISGGPFVERFEQDLGRRIKVSHVVSTSNGTTALFLALLGLGIGQGDEVIVPGFTFMAAPNMVLAVGARPVFADVDALTWCLDPQDVQRRITKRTKAVCVVHLYGNMADMRTLGQICKKHRLFLIEDAAQAAFSRYNGQEAGTFADVGTFSFHATKTIAMGEGGAVVTAHKKWHERMKVIRNHGMDRTRSYWHTAFGHNFRLPNLQAAIGCAQLERLEKIIALKERVYRSYRSMLQHIKGIDLQFFHPDVSPVVWAVAMKLDPKVFGRSRDQVMEQLRQHSIETRPGFVPAHRMPLYRQVTQEVLPVTEHLGAHTLSLPSYAQMTPAQIEHICSMVLSLRKPG